MSNSKESKKKQIERMKVYITKTFPTLDIKTIDFFAMTDSSLTYSENLENILSLHNLTLSVIDLSKKELECKETQAKKTVFDEATAQADEDFNSCIDAIVKDSVSNLDTYYKQTKHYVNLVCEGYSNSLIIVSEAGLGKSHNILRFLKEAGTPFEYRSGYSTPLQLYNDLWNIQNSEAEVIFYDDMDSFFSNDTAVSILKPALWSVGDSRTISYMSTSKMLNAPERFTFTKKIIFAVNELPQGNNNIKALYNRAILYNLEFTHKDKMKMFFELAKKDFKETTKEERMVVVNHLNTITNEATENLSMRTVVKGFQFIAYNKKIWKALLHNTIEINPYLEYIIKNESKFFNKELGSQFMEEFGKSQATFYRYMKTIKQRRGVM